MNPMILIPLVTVSALVMCLFVVLAMRGWLARWADRAEQAAQDGVLPASEGFGEDFAALPLAGRIRIRLLSFGQRFRPETEDDESELRMRLARAGLNSDGAVDLYLTVQAGAFAVAALLAWPWILAGDPGWLLLGLASCLGVAMLLPRIWLSQRTSKRKERISLALASTLDLLVVCMEAGLGLEQALARVSGELKLSEPEIAEELSTAVHEVQAGVPLARALRRLAERIDIDAMRMLVSVIIQAATMGAGVSKMLREYAGSWRNERMMNLEEEAGKMTARLTLPLTMCLLPSAILSMLGPAAIVVMKNLG